VSRDGARARYFHSKQEETIMFHAPKYSEMAIAAALCTLTFGCSSGDRADKVETTTQEIRRSASATLRDANGGFVGRVFFTLVGSNTLVATTIDLPASADDSIHGFHVHANDNPANGDGCIADPAQPANTHFVSADGHFNPDGGIHGHHAGDMPAVFVTAAGDGAMSFITDHFQPDSILGRAVILHALPDNYGNIPVGVAANQYTANSADATTLTNNTGNAGNRIACGLIN
jgi:Cu-Zn family superoxide dismutase